MPTLKEILPLIAVLVAWFVLDRLTASGIARAARYAQVPPSTSKVVQGAARVVLFVLAFLVATQLVGVAPLDLWGSVSTLLGLLAVGFVAFWSVLSNIVCGLVLFFAKPFRIGDQIEIFDPGAGAEKRGVEGTVKDLTLFYLVLESESNGRKELAFIPHNLVMQRGVRCVQ
jgi:small-conductance mechanosensitive channel